MHQAERSWESAWHGRSYGKKSGAVSGGRGSKETSPKWAFPLKEQCPFLCCCHGASHRAQFSPSQSPRSPHTLLLLLYPKYRPLLVLPVLPANWEEAGSYRYWEMSLPHRVPGGASGRMGGGQAGAASGLGRPARNSRGAEHYPPSTVGDNRARGVHVPASSPQPGSLLRFSSWRWPCCHGTLVCLWAFKATPTWWGVRMPSGVMTHRFHE